MGPAVFSLGRGGFFATVSMNVTYLKAARPHTPLIGQATVVHAGRRHIMVEASLVRESDGAEIARATSTNLLQGGEEA
jgi:acyl-coenzyme A thioesterase PaaI-like protein